MNPEALADEIRRLLREGTVDEVTCTKVPRLLSRLAAMAQPKPLEGHSAAASKVSCGGADGQELPETFQATPEDVRSALQEACDENNSLRAELSTLREQIASERERHARVYSAAVSERDSLRARLDEAVRILHDARLFLEDLPQDLGRGSLNGFRVQLLYKVCAALATT